MFIKILSYLAFVFYKFLEWTWTVEVHESPELKKLLEENSTFVVAHWHGEELGIMHLLKRYHVACIISLSKDGEIVNNIVNLLGSKTVRGSSSRGAVGALKGIIRLARQGWRPSVAVDGPRGPRHQVKPGVVEIARILKAPIVPISMGASRSKIFEKSWNKSELPKPFSKIHIYWGKPIFVSKEDDFAPLQQQIADALNDGRKTALSSVGRQL